MHWFYSKAAIEDVRAKNQICILDVDIQGVRRIKETDLDPIYISIQPPSMEILVIFYDTSMHLLINEALFLLVHSKFRIKLSKVYLYFDIYVQNQKYFFSQKSPKY